MSDPTQGKPPVFGQYARYFEILYHDKDYPAEARHILKLASRHGVRPQEILELGCGTGKHAVELAKLGCHVTGVDLSENMVELAEERIGRLEPELQGRMEISLADLRSLRLGRTFDAVIALFHVMSYQTTDADLAATIRTTAVHLKPGGLFFFDFWHGPGVLADPPILRIRRMEDDSLHITRIVEPDFQPERNCVVVHYQDFLRDKRTGAISEVREVHTMRYLFLPELETLLAREGMSVVSSGLWCSDQPLSAESRFGSVLARKD